MDPIVPAVSRIVGPAIDAIVAARPTSQKHFNAGGRWADLTALWRAQLQVALSRLSDEVVSARLRSAMGDALRTLCASEFETTLPSTPQTALAFVTLTRPDPVPVWEPSTQYAAGEIVQAAPGSSVAQQAQNAGTSGNSEPSFSTTLGVTTPDNGITWTCITKPLAPSGIIRQGTLFSKAADPTAIPIAIAAASYVSTKPVYVPTGTLVVGVPAIAQRAGVDANVPTFGNYASPTSIQPAAPLFDPTFATSLCYAAGGSSGISDDVLRAAARAYAIGQYGPNDAAVVAGLLQNQSVRHYAYFPANAYLAYGQVYIADESWACGGAWVNRIAQTFADSWLGFGCRLRFGVVTNTAIAIQPTIVLASSDALNYTDDIDASVRAAAKAYFDNRPDWYRWRLASLRAVLSKADPRILTCTSVTVTDPTTNATLSEPANTFGQAPWQTGLTHWDLTDSNVQASYQPPA